jgi:hypothetical protein
MTRVDGRLMASLFAIAFAAVAGCDQPSITNPSGTCGTRSGGGRAGYQVPGDDDQWIPDCQNPLHREYWRVFSQDGQTGYVIPRPDGAPELQSPCDDPRHDLHPVVDRYELCAGADSAEKVEIINHVELSDALRVTHFLHTQLKFAVTEDALGIRPFPIPADIVDACVAGERVNSAELEAICQRERDRIRSGIDIGFAYTGVGAQELVMRLNELYGIP